MDNTKPTLYLLRGVSGAGKSTLAKKLYEREFVIEHFEADKYFADSVTGRYNFKKEELAAAHKWCQDKTLATLRRGDSVVVSNTSTRKQDVQTYKKIAEEAGADFVSLIVENYHQGKSIHNVPPETLARQKAQFYVQL